MSIIRVFLNNGFFILILAVIGTIYIAYSTSPSPKSNEKPTEISIAASEIIPVEDQTQLTVELIENLEKITEEPIEEPIKEPVAEVKNSPEKSTVIENSVTNEAKKEDPSILEENETLVIEEPIAIQEESDTNIVAEVITKEKLPVENESKNLSIPKPNMEILKQFKSPQQALNAARTAFNENDFKTAEEIYFALALKTQQAEITNELANLLYLNDKKDWAKQVWLESAKQLLRDNRLQDAISLANHLSKIAPEVAEEIRFNLNPASKHVLQDVDL